MDCMRDGFDHGKLLDRRYLTVSPLNHGSFGMVFLAKDILTGDEVAIKCLTKAGATVNTNCPAAIAIDERSEELSIHSKLGSHRNIVNLLNTFETKNHQYMVLELCSNGDLYEAIRLGRGPLETEHVRDFMLQLVNAIDHLHSNGVYHRDIKPENIFLTSSGSMKLGDFGLATTDTWSTEFAVGSDRYMAPEQFESSVYGYGYSPASADIWAIGIVLLNILFQRNPFATPTQKDPLFADFARDRQSLFDVFPNMSEDTYNVIRHSLALDPANRSLGLVREALKSAVSFTTDGETLDDFCTTEQPELVPVATATREPLRTPSVTSPNMASDSFPWSSALLKTPQKTSRQLSTIRDDEQDLFPGSVKSSWQYVDTDESSLSSNVDSGLGMSYKSTKSSKSIVSRSSANFVGSLPISFSRGTKFASPYSANNFSKSWSDLWDEEEEMQRGCRLSLDLIPEIDIERLDTAEPSTPQLNAIAEDNRGSVTPRQGLAEISINARSADSSKRPAEEEKADLPKQRSSSILDKWAALGNFRRARQDAASSAMTSATATPTPQKSKYADAFSTLTTSFSSAKKQKPTTALESRDRSSSWRQRSPQRLRSSSVHNSQARERNKEKEHSPVHARTTEPWSRDNNWRNHSPQATKVITTPPMPSLPTPAARRTSGVVGGPSQQRKQAKKDFLTTEFEDDIGDLEWVGGWHDFQS